MSSPPSACEDSGSSSDSDVDVLPSPEPEPVVEDAEVENVQRDVNRGARPRRSRRPPTWQKDYVMDGMGADGCEE